jgi:ABC-2 type transport system permease protein
VLAGALVTVPLGTVLVAALAVAVPLDPDALAAVVVGTPLSVLVGSLFAIGIGTAFPRYEAVNITRSTKAVVPSLVAFLAYSLFLVLVVTAGGIVYEPAVEPFVAGLVSWLLPFGWSITPDTVGLAARAALVPLAVAPFASVWYAVRRFDAVTVD